tara:strand:+ start:1072 stop:1293 length:222 start_codon:yes stop_codon:yes gene_type:complete
MPFDNKALPKYSSTECKPKVVSYAQDVTEIYFDLTLIVSNDNKITVVDNNQDDYHNWLNSSTLTCQQVKIQIC